MLLLLVISMQNQTLNLIHVTRCRLDLGNNKDNIFSCKTILGRRRYPGFRFRILCTYGRIKTPGHLVCTSRRAHQDAEGCYNWWRKYTRYRSILDSLKYIFFRKLLLWENSRRFIRGMLYYMVCSTMLHHWMIYDVAYTNEAWEKHY